MSQPTTTCFLMERYGIYRNAESTQRSNQNIIIRRICNWLGGLHLNCEDKGWVDL
ncbi:MAG: hypothetical protein GX799_09960 [Crenarchaeota archaeon]|nr:hypothetical protein [Thermoproteota archaeon]